MDSLQMTVAGFSGHTDINKALEISLDVKRISNQLKECQTLAQLYNQRERLFGAPVTQYDKVYRPMIRFILFYLLPIKYDYSIKIWLLKFEYEF